LRDPAVRGVRHGQREVAIAPVGREGGRDPLARSALEARDLGRAVARVADAAERGIDRRGAATRARIRRGTVAVAEAGGVARPATPPGRGG
jgi:hypothetical protein